MCTLGSFYLPMLSNTLKMEAAGEAPRGYFAHGRQWVVTRRRPSESGFGRENMRVHVHVRGVEPSPELLAFVQRRAQFALGRFNGYIHSVSVRLWENPKPPAQRGCDVRITCNFHTPLVVRAQEDSLSAAVIHALDRAERAVSLQWRSLRPSSRGGFSFGD